MPEHNRWDGNDADWLDDGVAVDGLAWVADMPVEHIEVLTMLAPRKAEALPVQPVGQRMVARSEQMGHHQVVGCHAP
jgi:hypothetical protein